MGLLSGAIGSGGLIGLGARTYVTDALGVPDRIITTLGDPGGDSFQGVDEIAFSFTLTVDPATVGLIMEAGAELRGQVLYCANGKIVYECGDGGDQTSELVTGPAGPRKDQRGYVEWVIPQGLHTYRVEVSAKCTIPSKCELWVNSVLVATDNGTWDWDDVAGADGASVGQVTVGGRKIRNNFFSPQDPPAFTGTIVDARVWRNVSI